MEGTGAINVGWWMYHPEAEMSMMMENNEGSFVRHPILVLGKLGYYNKLAC